jgi:hypothetical protein
MFSAAKTLLLTIRPWAQTLGKPAYYPKSGWYAEVRSAAGDLFQF